MNYQAIAEATPSAALSVNREAVRALLTRFGVVSAGVFGSVARGEDRPGSDRDLTVKFAQGARRGGERIDAVGAAGHADAASVVGGGLRMIGVRRPRFACRSGPRPWPPR